MDAEIGALEGWKEVDDEQSLLESIRKQQNAPAKMKCAVNTRFSIPQSIILSSEEKARQKDRKSVHLPPIQREKTPGPSRPNALLKRMSECRPIVEQATQRHLAELELKKAFENPLESRYSSLFGDQGDGDDVQNQSDITEWRKGREKAASDMKQLSHVLSPRASVVKKPDCSRLPFSAISNAPRTLGVPICLPPATYEIRQANLKRISSLPAIMQKNAKSLRSELQTSSKVIQSYFGLKHTETSYSASLGRIYAASKAKEEHFNHKEPFHSF